MWESIKDFNGRFSERLKVPGGWLVRVTLTTNGAAVDIHFVEDPDHDWTLE